MPPFDEIFSILLAGIDLSSNKSERTKEMGSPSRFGSCRDTSAIDEVFSSPTRRSRLDLVSSPSKGGKLVKFAMDHGNTSSEEKTRQIEVDKTKEQVEIEKVFKDTTDVNDVDAEEDDGSYRSAQQRRLKKLASKFNDYVDEDSDSMKQVLTTYVYTRGKSLLELWVTTFLPD